MAKLHEPVAAASPTRIVLNARSICEDADRFFDLCADNPDLDLELTARKEIIIMPPAGGESGALNFTVTGRVAAWTAMDGTGMGLDSSGGFRLPNGAVRAADTSWIRRERWEAVDKELRRKFPPICPDFALELRCERNTLKELKEKMEEYIANGLQLGWLIDPFKRKVYIYRHGMPVECLDNPEYVTGDPVLRGFRLDLWDIW